MKDFFDYFFGKGEEVEFENFTLAHILPILVAAAVIYLIYRYRKQLLGLSFEPRIRFALALTMIITEMSYFWRLVGMPSLGANAGEHLPITICGWAIIFGSYMMVTKSQPLFDIVYFWVFAGTVFALAMPTMITYTGPTRFRYYQFWLEHTLGYVALFYMMFVHKMRPTKRSFLRSYVMLGVLAVVAYFTNRMLGPGANYLFLAEPESTPSVLDILPTFFPLRFLIMASIITAMFVLCYLPWYLMDRKAAKVK